MLRKKKKLLLASSLAGLLVITSTTAIVMSSCTTTSSSSSSDVQYNYIIDWNDTNAIRNLTIDDSGLVYSDDSKTTIIAISPKVQLATIKIPSNVKSIMGYTRVLYKNANGDLFDEIPTGQPATNYTKVYQQYGAFQNMESLENIIVETGSQLQSIGGLAFSGCIALETISGLSDSLSFIGTNAFANCANLRSINTSNVIKVGNSAFLNCANLDEINLSSAIYIGDFAFQNCSNLNSIGSLEKVVSLGQSAFSGAIKDNSNISLTFTNLLELPSSAFKDVKGIAKIDLSECYKLSSIGNSAFQNCSNLTTVYLPSGTNTSLTTIGSNAFANCTNLTVVNIKGATSGFSTANGLSSIGDNFLGNTSITSVDLSNFVLNNSSDTPFGSQTPLTFISNLKEIKLPDNLKNLNAGLFYGSGVSENAGFSLTLPNTITNIEYKATLNITNLVTNVQESQSNVTPFTNSGLISIDMSNITSYQSTNGSTTNIPNYLFSGNNKLTSVILKNGTTSIGNYVFSNTTALTSITYPSSSDTNLAADTINGFIASSDLTSIGNDAFNGAFSSDSNATVDLSQMNITTSSARMFSNSNVAILKLPRTIQSIISASFYNMPNLTSVNFGELTSLTAIHRYNFTNTKLKLIDLSNVTNASSLLAGNANNPLFTNLPVDCVVLLPNTLNTFNNVFTDINGNYVKFSYPNGISNNLVSITNGVLSFASGINTNLITNANSLNLSNQISATSIGPNTFFGNNNLSSLTLSAGQISTASGGLFSTTSTITANTSNTSDASNIYTNVNVPFGNNEAFNSLNYTGFTQQSNVINTIAETSSQQALFNTTDSTTWNEVAKIINSLSYQKSPTQDSELDNLKPNMSNWAAESSDANGNPINNDATNTFTASTESAAGNVVITNSYSSSTESNNSVTIAATDATKTIIHNGITWTYTNDGSTIKLVGSANMYKLTKDDSNKYLTFFDQIEYIKTGSTTTTYYAPSKTSVNITLTIATSPSSITK